MICYISSYLSGRKQSTNDSYSLCSHIKSGVPQGAIPGPLISNIYHNDIFYFVDKTKLTKYTDDNASMLLKQKLTHSNILGNKTSTLIKWFEKQLKMNSDKCKLLTTNPYEEVSAKLGNETVSNQFNY